MLYTLLHTAILLRMSWEDFKSRSIHAGLFVLWGVLVLVQYTLLPEELFINLSVLGIQILGIGLFVYLKQRGKKASIFHFIGLGDLLFIALAALHFPPIVFQITLLVALVLSLVYGWVARKPTQPLAGIYALVTIAAIWLTNSEVALLRNHFTQ